MHQTADLLRGRREPLAADHQVHRLRRRNVVAHRTDAAQALHHDRHLPVRPALDEFLEAAEFDDVQAHLVHVIVFIEQQGDLAVTLDAGHRIDGNAPEVGWGCYVLFHSGSNLSV